MKNNPFSIDFGGSPYIIIPREPEVKSVIDTFTSVHPSNHIFLIIGARGSGKTVLMGEMSTRLKEDKKWIHIDLSSEGSLLENLAGSLYQRNKSIFDKVNINISVGSVSVSTGVASDSKYQSIYTDLDLMMEKIAKKNKKLLITIDEINNSKNIREFTTFFQRCLRNQYPVFLLATGLYKNVKALQNNKSQTFLKRAPKIIVEPLSIRRIADRYADIFNLDDKKALQIAKLTCGYSYGFQMLGYLLYNAEKCEISTSLSREYRSVLWDNSYDKIWEELSQKEKEILFAVSEQEKNASVLQVRKLLDMHSGTFSAYKSDFEYSGIFAKDASYGTIKLALPFFREYIQFKKDVE
ncbi:MAG: ATP-binding protein [Clostridiales bacterium]|nr:ATP-binding protein [Clostridiales bacterium]